MFSVVNHLSIDPRFGNFQMCETDFNSIFFSYFSVPIKSNFYFQQTKMCKIQNETLLQIKFCKQGVTNVSHFIAIDSIVLREKKKFYALNVNVHTLFIRIEKSCQWNMRYNPVLLSVVRSVNEIEIRFYNKIVIFVMGPDARR